MERGTGCGSWLRFIPRMIEVSFMHETNKNEKDKQKITDSVSKDSSYDFHNTKGKPWNSLMKAVTPSFAPPPSSLPLISKKIFEKLMNKIML